MEGGHLESLRTADTKILKYTCKKWDVDLLLWVRIGRDGKGLSVCCNKHSPCMKLGNFLTR
jgi:hypothetical protein